MNGMNWTIRLAQREDIPELEKLIPLSVRALQEPFYSPAQMEAALGPVFGVDHQLIQDGTYFVVEHEQQIIGCGGWSRRNALHGGNTAPATDKDLLDPKQHPARIRAFFVHPHWARRGIGRAILSACEAAVQEAGFRRAELVATLSGEPLFAALGYTALERYDIELPDQLSLPVVRMGKHFQ
jgi:GNAT superfamily N-acetyltransferase